MSASRSQESLAQLFDLRGKVAVVTGGAMGIGQGIALRLAEAGAAVIIADINLEAAQQTANMIVAKDGKAKAVRADASSQQDAEKVMGEANATFGRLDILVNNAGIFPMSPVLETSPELWQKVIGVNLNGTFYYAQAAARAMIAQGHSGRIVNIASIDALHPTGNLVHYDASKGGVAMMTKSLALELGRHGITVNAIAPGAIDTPGARATTAAPAGQAAPSEVDIMAAFLARIPLGRQGVPDDIAKAALFLASAAADYITGSLLVVDGGYLLS